MEGNGGGGAGGVGYGGSVVGRLSCGEVVSSWAGGIEGGGDFYDGGGCVFLGWWLVKFTLLSGCERVPKSVKGVGAVGLSNVVLFLVSEGVPEVTQWVVRIISVWCS